MAGQRPIGFPVRPTLSGAVKTFIDITGASGAVYRFDAIASAVAAPTVAGNFVFARLNGRTVEVICCGSTVSLNEVIGRWGAEIEPGDTQGIFVRLNTLRAARDREHKDIVEKHRPELVVTDRDEG